MKRLTEKERWNLLYEKGRIRTRRRAAAKRKFANEGVRKYFYPYSEYLFWNVILKRQMPRAEGTKVLEVGSAPGDFLVRLHKIYGVTPYGVEYSETGVVQNKELFRLHNIDPDNVIHADFFDDEFHEKFRGYFDIVVSWGFIEHFTDVEEVIERHLNVLAEGGKLIILIPNLNRRSLYGVCASLFDRERLKIHNLDIMSKEAFTQLFDRRELTALFCDHFGTLRLGMISSGNIFLVKCILYARHILQRVLDPILHLVFRDKGFENRWFSPFLLYIGLKAAKKHAT